GAGGGAGCRGRGGCAGGSDRAAGCVMAAFPLPTTRLAALCGAGAALLLAGALARPLVRVALVWDGALALALVVDLAARRRAPDARRLVRGVLARGRPVRVAIELSNPAAVGARVELCEAWPMGFVPARVALSARLAARGRARLEYQLLPKRRGRHQSAPTAARILGPLGLTARLVELIPPARVWVVPNLRAVAPARPLGDLILLLDLGFPVRAHLERVLEVALARGLGAARLRLIASAAQVHRDLVPAGARALVRALADLAPLEVASDYASALSRLPTHAHALLVTDVADAGAAAD